MRIGIACDLKSQAPPPPGFASQLPDDWQEEFDDPATVEAIAAVLRGLGHEVRILGDGPELLRQLLADPPDFVFNIAEGWGISRTREARVPAVLEMLGIPHSGSDPLTLAVTLDKACAHRLVSGCCPSLRVPFGVEGTPETDWQALNLPEFPLIAKPAWEGSSKGIRGTSLVRTQEELMSVLNELHQQHRQPILLEEFIDGDELTVGILGNARPHVLGIMHVVPLRTDGQPFIYSLEVKRDWRRQVRYELFRSTPTHQTLIESAALEAYRALGCRDVCRIDFRLDRNGVPVFLEANPLPGLNPESSDLVLLARLAGWTYEQLITAIFDEAVSRQLSAISRSSTGG